MENADIAQLLSQMADILELTDGNAFRVRAYRQAAQVVDTLPGPLTEYWRKGELDSLPGIGARIAAIVSELLDSGRCREHERMVDRVPAGVLEMLRLEGVGPKTVAAVWKSLDVTGLDALADACGDGRLRALPRMGPARVRSISEAIERYRRRSGRMPLHRALAHAETLLARLRRAPGVLRAEAAGSVRRRRETVGDLDLLVAAQSPEPVTRAFVSAPEVDVVLAEGPTKSAVRLRSGLQVDLRVLPLESFGAALHYFTGSKSHNIALRTRAVHMGIKISEYGAFDREGRRLGGAREEEIFQAVGLPWIPPELREGAGEIEAAEQGRLPRLVEERDILGDLHVHTDASTDAYSSVEELRGEARRLGRRYLAVTDHSRSRPLGLDANAVAVQAQKLRDLQARSEGPRLLTGIEVDILPDGGLDLPNDTLAALDWVVASIHSHFRDDPDAITARLVSAIRSGVIDVIGHPSGRIIGQRDPYSFDLERVLAAAREEGVALEINAQPERLDLTDKACRLAHEFGVRMAIDTDAHLAGHLGNMRYGVWVARRGWLGARDVVNAAEDPRRRRRGAFASESAQPV